MLKEEQEGSVMAEYQRFVAYFYEYINGKRTGNAGFVRVNRRNGGYRLHLQLRREIWQPQPLAVYGYREQGRRNGEENRSPEEKLDYYQVTYLGKGWPQGDSFIRKLEFQDEEEEENQESLAGLWIPAGGDRCFISHWQEGEVEPERLKTPEELRREKEEQDRNKAKKTDIYREKDTEEKVEREEEKKEEEKMDGEFEKAGEPDTEIDMGKDETEDKEEKKVTGQKNTDTIIRKASINIEDDRENENQIRETRFGTGREPQECLEAMQRVKIEKEAETKSEWRQHWNMLRQHHRRIRPFEGVQTEGLMICPRDVMWLREQGWPVGRNSFMMQGFVQYHHLLLYDDGSRGFLLGVPGRDCYQERKQSADFGFPEFVPGHGGGLGYWCRRLKE